MSPHTHHGKAVARYGRSHTRSPPAEVDAERVDARYADGTLTLKLAKVAEAKPRQITVKT